MLTRADKQHRGNRPEDVDNPHNKKKKKKKLQKREGEKVVQRPTKTHQRRRDHTPSRRFVAKKCPCRFSERGGKRPTQHQGRTYKSDQRGSAKLPNKTQLAKKNVQKGSLTTSVNLATKKKHTARAVF